jgi:UDP-N-acetylglucosamine 4,6-dehydratase
MCPADDSHLTLEFTDHFVIRPTITFSEGGNNYSPNKLGEAGAPAPQGFEYNSGSNERFLNVPEIVEFNRLAGIA